MSSMFFISACIYPILEPTVDQMIYHYARIHKTLKLKNALPFSHDCIIFFYLFIL